MRETKNKKTQNNNQIKRSARTQRKDNKLLEQSSGKTLTAKETQSKASHAEPVANYVVSHTNLRTEPSEVYEKMVVHYLDDIYRSEDSHQDTKSHDMVVEHKNGILADHSADPDGDSLQVKEEESDAETVKDSVSSQVDSLTVDDEKIKRASRVPKKLMKKDSSEISVRLSRLRSDHDNTKAPLKWSHATPKKPMKSIINGVLGKDSSDSKSKGMSTCSSSDSSEGVDDKPNREPKEETFNEGSNAEKSIASDDDTARAQNNEMLRRSPLLPSHSIKNVENDDKMDDVDQNDVHPDKTVLNQKIELMETRIEKLEQELREVAALEISLYSVVPEHGSSAHKVHTPARRLSRLYIHACKHWTQNKRATVARNTISGLILAARTCGNDVARLTFWLSNTLVLRVIVSQAFGTSCHSTVVQLTESNGSRKTSGGKFSSLKLKGNAGGKKVNEEGLTQLVEDWQETGMFMAALEKVEFWIFSRIVESVWWQTFTPHMQSPVEDLITSKSIGKLWSPALGNQQQGSFSIDLWKYAFMDAARRLCSVRAEGHECGCLPVLARLVIEQCIARLDVAMFNAILRESAHQIPTDPVSDPIVDSRVLPIPAGDLSFGSGAQLKNAVGNWSRYLGDLFGMETGYPPEDHQDGSKGDDQQHTGHAKPKCFQLLDELSDLLMLPKDMLMDRSIRKEVCPSITLPLVKQILCNFSPDEFCPDPVPGEVLEVLNAESVVEQRLSGDSTGSVPYAAAPLLYPRPSSADVAEKVAEAGGKSQLERNAYAIQKEGYTSDEELEVVGSPLTSFVDNFTSSPNTLQNGSRRLKLVEQTSSAGLNARYKLLREVWSV